MAPASSRRWSSFVAIFCHLWMLLAAASGDKFKGSSSYSFGQAIPISCLNRTTDTGEHISDAQGQLQFIPFPVCNETGRPLELNYGVDKEMNCTIESISDTLFHLLEFYVHNDAPLTCRIPSTPLPETASSPDRPPTSQGHGYIPFVVALTGSLQLSHLHVANHLNVLVHTASASVSASAGARADESAALDAATAYSISPSSRTTKLIIGDPLPLYLSVRWFRTPALPRAWASGGNGIGGHLYASTLGYCLLSALAAAALCTTYFRAVELPRRLRGYRGRAVSVAEAGRYNGYGYGIGKRD